MKTQRPSGIETQRPSGIDLGVPAEIDAKSASRRVEQFEHMQMTVGQDFDIAKVSDGWELVSAFSEPGLQQRLFFKRRKA